MTTQEQIKLLVNYTNGDNKIKAAIAQQVLNSFEEIDIIDVFFEDFCSSELDQDDLSQLLGMASDNLYENMTFSIIRNDIKKNLFELANELDIQ